MRAYTFEGRGKGGERVSGTLPANSSAEVAEQLAHQGVTPLKITLVQRSAGAGFFGGLLGQKPPSVDDLVMLCRQMQTLVRAGVPMSRAVQGIQGGVHNPMLYQALGQIVNGLEAGMDLSSAMAEHPKIFSNLFINMVKIGEQTGRLEEAFNQLYHYMALDHATRKQIKSALRYPMFIIGGMMAALFIMTYFVLPNFFGFFDTFKLELPWQTKLLMASSRFTVDYWYLMVLGLAGSIGGFIYYTRTPEGTLWWGAAKFKLPVVGDIIKRGTLARFARSFSMGSRSGVPILVVLESVTDAVDNRFVAKKVWDIMRGIERGETLVQSAYATGLFPPLVVQMLAVGEETGSIDQMMDDVATFYEQEVEYDVKSLSSVIEPIITVIMGGMVLLLAMGVFLPLWDLIQGATPK